MYKRQAMLLAEQTDHDVILFGMIAVADEIRPEARAALQLSLIHISEPTRPY